MSQRIDWHLFILWEAWDRDRQRLGHSFATAEQFQLLNLSSRLSPLSLRRAKGGLKGGQMWSATRSPFFLKATSGVQKSSIAEGMWTLKVGETRVSGSIRSHRFSKASWNITLLKTLRKYYFNANTNVKIFMEWNMKFTCIFKAKHSALKFFWDCFGLLWVKPPCTSGVYVHFSLPRKLQWRVWKLSQDTEQVAQNLY